jgi:hypothetical protein
MQPTTESAAEMIATIESLRRRSRLRRLADLRDRLNNGWDRLWSDEQRRTKALKRVGIGLVLGAAVGGVGLYFILRPYPQPDYAEADIDELFNFTLLKEEFNRLPIDRRLELLAMLRARIEAMGAGESALLAAFAAGIGGRARDQLEENISKLMIDIWDQHAADYPSIPEGDKPGYLEDTFVEIARAMQTVAGDAPSETDAELVADVKEQARRDRKAMEEGHGPGARELSRIFDVMNNNVGGNASPQQRSRGQVMMRDMMRQFRGQDLRTGKPLR